MIAARRHFLQGADVQPLSGSTHAGLWLDRFMKEQEKRGQTTEKGRQPKPRHLSEVVELGAPNAYADFFASHQSALEQLGFDDYQVKFQRVKVVGRLVTGLGAANVLENGIALHHTYGVPYLPGSGLKGLAARVARGRAQDPQHRWKKGGAFYDMTFGSTEEAGGVEFFDALPMPGTGFRLVQDVLTPHHQKYNAGENVPPADWDSPVPIPFLSVEGTFQLALFGPRDWVTLALEILLEGLKTEGFGAKTSSGFGRMEATV